MREMPGDPAIESFVVSNAGYYRDRWWKFRDRPGSIASFNWAACLGQIVWLVYRKLYGPLFWVVLATVVHVSLMLRTPFAEEESFVSSDVLAAWNLLGAAVFCGVIGACGNYWYWKKFTRTTHLARSRATDEPSQLQLIRAQGGTNPVGAGLLVALLVMPVVWAVYQANRVDHSGYVFDAAGPLTVAEVRANFLDRMDEPMAASRQECIVREIEERALAAGDPQTLDPKRVEFLPARTWAQLDRFGKRLVLAQAIVTKASFVCIEDAASRH